MPRNFKQTAQTGLGLLMLTMMLLAYAYHWTGGLAHELLGLAMILLVIVHSVINGGWRLFRFKAARDLRKPLGLTVNLCLAAAFLTLTISGLMISNYFSVIVVKNGFLARQIHTLAAYWVLVLSAVHVGFYWPRVSVHFGKLFAWLPVRFNLRMVMKTLTVVAIASYGVKASFDRDMGSKLLMTHSFDYWDFDASTLGFFLTYLALMGLYICATHYLLKLYGGFLSKRRSLTK